MASACLAASASAVSNCLLVSLAEVVFPKSIGRSWTVVTPSAVAWLTACVTTSWGTVTVIAPSDWPVDARLSVCSATGVGWASGKLVAGFSVNWTVLSSEGVTTSSACATWPLQATTAVTIVPSATEQSVRYFLLLRKTCFSAFSWLTKKWWWHCLVIKSPSFLLISSNIPSLSPHHKKDDLILVSHQKQRKKLSVALPITSENCL